VRRSVRARSALAFHDCCDDGGRQEGEREGAAYVPWIAVALQCEVTNRGRPTLCKVTD
jgi:hypothetical protein